MQLQKYVWLIDTIRRAGMISHKDLSDSWQRHKELSDNKPLPRSTFNRWRENIISQFGIRISCRKTTDYRYYIDNPEVINNNNIKKWLLDSLAVGNIISENLSLKDRILIDDIPSGQTHLTPILEAMRENSVIEIVYRPFQKGKSFRFLIEPYCVKLFENRWYVVAHNISYGDIRIYGLDRVEHIEKTTEKFKLPKNFSASDYFFTYYGIVVDKEMPPQKIVVRANKYHKPYMKSLPIHHSQRLIEETNEYADFELYLSPTYDFEMKLLQMGPMIEVRSPRLLRETIKNRIKEIKKIYE